MTEKVKCWYGPGGALVTNAEVEGLLLWEMDADAAQFYGGKYLIGESMTENTASRIAEALGLDYAGPVTRHNIQRSVSAHIAHLRSQARKDQWLRVQSSSKE